MLTRHHFGIGALLLALLLAAPAGAVTVSAAFVKTLGQSAGPGALPFLTAGGRLAVDDDGSVFAGSPGHYNPLLHRLGPDGRVAWQLYVFGCAFQAMAVDGKYLYNAGLGYYGHAFLQRRLKESGQPAPGWQYDWDLGKKENNKPPADKVPALARPSALLADEKYLYVADAGGNEIRRFDKETGAEAPFAARLLVVKPLDLAFTKAGTILVLTEDAVFEADRAGKPLRVPVVAGLRTPVALDVSRKTGAIYVAEAGDNAELVNRIRMYDPDGKPLDVEIGIGGDFNGHWYPLAFAFSSGAGDIALDPQGGLWVNGNGHRMEYCPLLTHLSPGPRFAPDLTLRGVGGTGLAVDPALGVIVGGSYKISWDDALEWTSGLVDPGPAGLFPTTLGGWMMTPVWSDGTAAVIASVHYNNFYQVNAKNGAALGKSVAAGTVSIAGCAVVGRDVYYTGAGRVIQRTTLDLDAPQPFLTLPEGVTPVGPLAVSPDRQFVYAAVYVDLGKPAQHVEIACFRRDGTQAWSARGGAMALCKGVVVTGNPDGPGLVALDAATGARVGLFASVDEAGRPAVAGVSALALGARDGADYLFVHTGARIAVYRLTVG